MVVVRVRIRPLEPRMQLELDQGDLLAADLDRRDTVVRLQPLSFSGLQEDRFRRRLAASRRRVDAVEAAFLTAITRSQVVRKAAVGRVEVEEERGRRAPEAVHDLRRRADERARLELLLLVVDEHREPALEHVKRIRVPAVEVRIGAVASVREMRLRDAKLPEGRLEHDPAVEERLALARSEHDSVHAGRV